MLTIRKAQALKKALLERGFTEEEKCYCHMAFYKYKRLEKFARIDVFFTDIKIHPDVVTGISAIIRLYISGNKVATCVLTSAGQIKKLLAVYGLH